MSHMGNSGKVAAGAFLAALGMLVLTAITLEAAVLLTFLGLVAVGYVASVAEAFSRRRHLALLAGAAGTSLFIGCTIAFLRMWGLAFNQDPAALDAGVATTDSDIYFYLAVASGTLTLLVLFAAAVWPSRGHSWRRSGAPVRRRRPAPSRASAGRPASQRQPAQRQAAQAQPAQRQTGKTGAARSAAGRPRR
ncbi:hypothetical protein [Arthrobacter sp. NPDC093139]|uniref:hypothetical protein n=1 Tax=Arthrobacter sp. NPDC093139 TaxID=3363945 RepID=UPI00382FB858